MIFMFVSLTSGKIPNGTDVVMSIHGETEGKRVCIWRFVCVRTVS